MGDNSVDDSVTFTKVPLIPCEKLTGTANYNIWAASVKLWFQGQGREDHLTKEARDIATVNRTKWKQVDASLCTVLWFSIAPNLQAQYQAFTTCYEVWEKAKKVFTNDVHRLYSVVLSLNSLKLENMDVQAYLSKLDSLKADFQSLMPFTNDRTSHAEQRSKFFMIMALVGLPPELDSVRNQILSGSTIPDYETLLPPTTMVVVDGVGGRGGQRSRCNYCFHYGHIEADCRTKAREQNRPPRVAAVAQPTITKDITIPAAEYNEFLQFKAAHHPSSSAAVAQSGNPVAFISTSSLGPWVLDSSASDHMTADGSKIKVQGLGQAHPLPNLSLDSVLYIPGCPFNLISVNKLTRTLDCSVLFTNSSVSVQDRRTGRTIGAGSESGGLYHLSPAVACVSVASQSLTHQRFGHPSLNKMRLLVPSFSKLSSFECQSCQLGKHTRNTYSQRVNKSVASPFALVHSDIWGPSRVKSTLAPSPAPIDPPATSPAPEHPIALRKGIRSSRHPNPKYACVLNYDRLSTSYVSFVSALDSVSIPKSTGEAMADPNWRQAMVEEMAALHSNNTWDIVSLPPDKTTVGCRWVYTVKVRPDGQIDRFKARLGAKGYTQIFGLDYGDTFSPVAKISSVRLFLAMAAIHHWPLHQLDIKNAFLHGELEEEVYMDQPPGFTLPGNSRLVCRLRRSLYGLKQSPRAWFGRFSSALIQFDDPDGIQRLKAHLFKKFQTKDLGPLRYFLGIEVAQSSSGIAINQRKYALDILSETGMLDSRPIDTPMDPNVKLLPGQGEPLKDPGRYRRLVGRLNYLTIYKEAPGRGLLYEDKGDAKITCYSDADWAGSPSDRRSTSGYCVLIGGNMISWRSKKQNIVALSSAEAEYRAMAATSKELAWLKNLLLELRLGDLQATKLICDNQAALHIASNPVFHERTKHIEIDCHYVRDKVLSGEITTDFVKSEDQLADMFTKSLKGDITKLNCVSSFSASKYPINDFFPISLFDLQTKGLGLSYASIEEKAEKLLEATNFWHSEQRETCVYLPTEDVAMWFLVSTPSDFDYCQNHVSTSSHHDVHTARSWRLALLVKNSIVFGSPLDPRTTTVGVSGGYGIISTSDGVVYMWELSRGSKLDTLHHFHDGTVTSLATDDLNSNSRSAVGVAGDAGQMLLYLHFHELDSKE
ncbi:hypothetical protein TSUD_188740 [Trifolium subterraneum]|uniref:Reverse transcriptase Ty1/copia-type domain-containing protein n=1 Tax=Trifolium subterraneum TaxID=3900 RepID=A0A2Z6P1G1_TRISU|nr:hypothetical protein TSUD_188740 [Trifolium subterraneum]